MTFKFDTGEDAMETSPCQPRTLAQLGAHRVDLCGCGQVHVHIGVLTIRLDRAQYLRLCDALLAALRQLPQDDEAAALH
jgi:hypothetical protein